LHVKLKDKTKSSIKQANTVIKDAEKLLKKLDIEISQKKSSVPVQK
jgi:hypothetical protein